jgi:hypothetical protein
MLPENLKQPFNAIANRKGHPIHWDSPIEHEEFSTSIHLDMNMVEASLDSAIHMFEKETNSINDVERRKSRDSILISLKNLRSQGSTADKVRFVMTSGTYYFSEDLERMADSAESNDHRTSSICKRVCEPVIYFVCRCICTPQPYGQDCEQFCREMEKNVCRCE